MSDEDAVIAVLRELERAHDRKDPAALEACFAPDVLVYNLAPPLATRGCDREGLDAWFATWDGPILLDCADAEISVEGDLAVAAGMNRMRGTKTDGEKVDLWFRATTILRRTRGRWRIVHDHTSTPFYMDGSQRAATDLQPAEGVGR